MDTAKRQIRSVVVTLTDDGATVFVGGVAEDTSQLVGGRRAIRCGRLRRQFRAFRGSWARHFFFASTAQAGDTISDFSPVDDIFSFENSGFGAGVGTGTLAQAGVDFVLGSTATRANETLIYNQATGQLFWDANGTRSGGIDTDCEPDQ